MATLYTQQSKNIHKTWLLMSLFFAVIIALGWLFSYIYNSAAILYFAIILSVVMNVGSYWWSDKIVLKLSRAVPADPATNQDLIHIVENLSITAGLPMPKVYLINDPAPNAFATGRNKEHAVVCVTTGLLQILNHTELEGVIAHELSHVGNRDTLISTMVVVLVGLVTLMSDFFLRSLWWGGIGGRRGNDREGNQLGIILLVLGIVGAIISPLVATLIQLAISRKREFLADASGALLTRYPEGLASALQKIAAYSQPMRHANNATAHLFIANPFGPKAMSGISRLFMTHPPIEERIKALIGDGQI